MSVAYIDTSALVAVAFGEDAGPEVARRLEAFARLISSKLLEAELRATFNRECLAFEPDLVSGIEWVLPDRPLTAEFATALDAGHLRGADLWHVATALYVAGEADRLSFVTLDQRQRDAAAALGFQS